MPTYKRHTIMTLTELADHAAAIGSPTQTYVPIKGTSTGVVLGGAVLTPQLADPDNARFLVMVDTEFDYMDKFEDLYILLQYPFGEAGALSHPHLRRVGRGTVDSALNDEPNTQLIFNRNEHGYLDMVYSYQ